MRKILVIEANGEQHDCHLSALTKEGYEIIQAETIPAALEMARTHNPDLILCGLELTGGDNFELLQYLQGKPDLLSIPIILLTPIDNTLRWRQCVALGADDCLVTPFTERDLLEAIAGRLRKQDALTNRYNTLMRYTAERLNRLSHYDSLTDLPNYQLLRQRLMQAMRRAANGNQRVALLTLSIDRLRQVNNTLGYTAGDTLLRATARRLTGILPPSTAVARLTGNQFAIVVPAPQDRDTIVAIAEQIFESLGHSFSLPGQEVFMTASIGIALFPDDSEDINVLLRQADAALDWAKIQKSHSYRFYRKDMPVVSGDELQLETWLRYALERDEFEVWYQPKYSLSEDRIVGAEALIRWQHPESGYISPGHFVPLAENTGLIVPVGDWVLRTVCDQTAAWLRSGQPVVAIAVNLSSVQLNQSRLAQSIQNILTTTQLPPEHLELEVTETALMQDIESAIDLLQGLKALGVKIAIDDFGTGYASLAYLRQLPIDILKIDTSFVRDIPTETKNQIIVKRVTTMAHDLGLKVIAEGVETEEEMAVLKSYGCDLIQGYWVGTPMVAEELAKRL
ncbi:EAL domain-containing protein [Oscillatoria sp. CS-180]|uniref:putative bifunctional diguanylate cyclase/phosphodiesterase n=1 Tax=Oscillatoria sp. CS-180 TaxID=3021720 RepID=UPI00232CC315|nr:EAL domain-containing protein [Oscillatoria sp. CS-180]MDB9526859.1 EAL domain-containing protein [Oscillatoria sp. CS-180]